MSDGPITVLIPLAGRAGGARGVTEIICDRADRLEHVPAGYDPRVTALKDANLMPAARVAIDALRTFRLGRRITPWRWPRLTPVRDLRARLAPGNSSVTAKLNRENVASAEFGIALGLMAIERRGRTASFVATGALAFGDQEGALRRTGPVSPVGGIAEKLAAIGDWLENHAGSHRGKRLPVFLPLTTDDSLPLDKAFAQEIEGLVARGRALEIMVEPRPVASLAEAAAAIGATNTPRPDAREIGAWSGVAALLLAAAFTAWALGETGLEPAAIPFGPELAFETPRPFRPLDDERREPLEICRDAPGKPLQVAVDDLITFRAETGQSSLPELLAWGLEILGVLIHETDGADVFGIGRLDPADRPHATAEGRVAVQTSFPVREAGSRMKLVFLARKLRPYAEDDIQAAMTTIFAARDRRPAQKLNAAAQYLESLPGGFAEADFVTVEDYSTCTPSE